MNRRQMITALAEKTGSTKKAADEFITAFEEVVTEQLKAGERVQLTGFGSFYVNKRDEHMGRNPQNGKLIKIKATKVPMFKAGTDLKEGVNA